VPQAAAGRVLCRPAAPGRPTRRMRGVHQPGPARIAAAVTGWVVVRAAAVIVAGLTEARREPPVVLQQRSRCALGDGLLDAIESDA